MDSKVLVSNIQRFSLHDGPGIRTTIFTKGCTLNCPWCSNPECIDMHVQSFSNESGHGVYGHWYTSDELLRECLKDKVYYSGVIMDPKQWNIKSREAIELLPGGVTLSGGEPLMQITQMQPFLCSIKKENVHVAMETSLFSPICKVKQATEFVDLFYVDMKILIPERAKIFEGGDIEVYLDNFSFLASAEMPIVVRIPVIGGYTDERENRQAIKNLLLKHCKSILKVELLKEHHFAEKKYASLGKKVDYHGVSDEIMQEYYDELRDLEIPIEICNI